MKTRPSGDGIIKTAKLRLDAIRLDDGMRTRAHIDDCTVAEYSEAMLRGDRFPPVVVFRNDGVVYLADGWHRVRAASRARLSHILVEVRPGGRKDALRFALGCNDTHGLRRSNADKRRCVEIALAEFSSLSNHLLAEMCAVSVQTVGNIRQQLSILDSSPRLGKDGKRRVLPTRGIHGLAPSNAGVNGSRALPVNRDIDNPNGDQGSAAFTKIAAALAGLEEMIDALVHNYPEKTAAVLALIAKTRSDLLQVEKRLRGQAGL